MFSESESDTSEEDNSSSEQDEEDEEPEYTSQDDSDNDYLGEWGGNDEGDRKMKRMLVKAWRPTVERQVVRR